MSETFLLTGALGCIGAWVTRRVIERGHQPVVYDLGGDPRRLRDVLSEDQFATIRFVQGDVTDGKAVRSAIEDHGVTRLVHLAGLQVPFCKADPALGASVNVVGTVQLFQAAHEAGIPRLVYASSAAVYGPPQDERAPDESAPCEPSTHYGVYKRANEGNARIYWQDQGLSSVGLRPLTVYGVGRDQGLTSGPTTAMKAAVVDRDYSIGFTGATDFNYVADTAAAFVSCAEGGPEGAHVFNLHGDSVSVERILEEIRAHRPAGSRAHIDAAGPVLPIPPSIDGRAIDEAYPDLDKTPLAQGIEKTMQRFLDLLEAGRLDTRDLDK